MTGTAKELNCMDQHSAERSEDGYPLMNEKKCRGCGKVIFVTPDWVFKRNVGKGVDYFCKYTCMKHFEEKKKAQRRAYTTLK